MLVTEPTQYAEFRSWLAYQRAVSVDTETTGLNPYSQEKARICGLAVAGFDGRSWYLPFRHAEGPNLPITHLHDTLSYAGNRTNDGSLRLGFWTEKFDLHMMCADGYPEPLRGVEDWMLAAHLLNENEPSFGLKEYADKYGLGAGSLDEIALRSVIEARFGRQDGKTWKGLIHRLPAEQVADYAESDVLLTLKAEQLMRPALATWRLDGLFDEISRYALLIFRMERRGVLIDVERVNEHMATVGPARLQAFNEIMAKVKEITGSHLNPIIQSKHMPRVSTKTGKPLKVYAREQFNPNSTNQVCYLTGWDKCDVHFIEELETDSPWYDFGHTLLDYRVLSKMTGTYYDAYLELIDPFHVLRPNYNMHGTVNGRLSCSKPNLQNVPRWTERRPVKEVFIPRPGYEFVEMDYQQAELRIACHYASKVGNVNQMITALASGGDPHGEIAARLGITRHAGKTMNFLTIYGGGIPAIVRQLGCEPVAARAYLNGYHALNPGFQELSKVMQNLAERDGYIRMETGRIRHFNTWKRHRWESDTRKAMNSLIQGTAAEMLRIGMMRFDEAVRAEGLDVHLILQVHDSILLEARPEHKARALDLLADSMLGFGFYPAPAIETKSGSRWAPMGEAA
jgi:DNA polymerase-1